MSSLLLECQLQYLLDLLKSIGIDKKSCDYVMICERCYQIKSKGIATKEISNHNSKKATTIFKQKKLNKNIIPGAPPPMFISPQIPFTK